MKNLNLQAMNEEDLKGILVEDVGLLFSRTNSSLGALLDGIVKCSQDTSGLDIKCPYSKYYSILSSALTDKKCFLKKMTPLN